MLQNPCGTWLGCVRRKDGKLSYPNGIIRTRKVIHKMRILRRARFVSCGQFINRHKI